MADDRTQIIYCAGEEIPVVLPTYYNNGDIALFAGGWNTYGVTYTIQSFYIPTGQYTSYYGDLYYKAYDNAGCSNSVDAYFGGTNENNYTSSIDKFTIIADAPSSATEFGALTSDKYGCSSCSNGVLGLWGGGYDGDYVITIDQITLSNQADATNFGTLINGRQYSTASADEVTGIMATGYFPEGYDGVQTDTIESILFATGGQASNFGTVTVAREGAASTADKTTMLIASGLFENAEIFSIESVTIDSAGNASNWGDLIIARYYFYGCGNDTHAIFGAGYSKGAESDISAVDIVAYASGGTATNFGQVEDKDSAWGGSASGGGGVNNPIDPLPDVPVNYSGESGLVTGGYAPDGGRNQSTITHFNMFSEGDTTHWGDMSFAWSWVGAVSSDTHAFVHNENAHLEKISYASESNGVVGMDIGYEWGYPGQASDNTTGLFVGGSTNDGSWVTTNKILKIDFSGETLNHDFGSLGVNKGLEGLASFSDGTYCFNAGGWGDYTEAENNTTLISKVLFASGGEVTEFGDMSMKRGYFTGCSNNFIGVMGGGWDGEWIITSSIDSLLMASETNATEYGTLDLAREDHCAFNNHYSAIFGGGSTDGSNSTALRTFYSYNLYSGYDRTYYGSTDAKIEGPMGTSNFIYDEQTTGPLWEIIYPVVVPEGVVVADESDVPVPTPTAMALICGGRAGHTTEYMWYDTGGVAVNFGDMIVVEYGLAGASNVTKGLMGYNDQGYLNNLESVLFDTTGSWAEYGTLGDGRRYPSACSDDDDRVVWAGGYNSNVITGWLDNMTSATMSATSMTANWGTLSTTKEHTVAISNDTECIFSGGWEQNMYSTMDGYFFSSGGSSSDYGELDIRFGFVGAGGTNVGDTGVMSGGNNGNLGGEGFNSKYVWKREINSSSNNTLWGSLIDYSANCESTSNRSDTCLFVDDSFESRYETLSMDIASETLASSFATQTTDGGSSAFISGIGLKMVLPPSDACYKGLFIGGEFSGNYSVKINIKEQATSTLFGGLLTENRFGCKATSNGYLALIGTGSSYTKSIDSMLIVEEADATSFGDLIVGRNNSSVCTDGTTSLWCGGNGVDGYTEGLLTIESLEFDTGGTATLFGDINQNGFELGFAASDNTVAIFGGISEGYTDYRRVDRIEFSSGGTATTFGTLMNPRTDTSSVENSTKAIIWSGNTYDGYSWIYAEDIEQIEFATGGNANLFGSLATGREYAESCEDATTGILGTGYNGQYHIQYDYITMDNASNSTVFGDLYGEWDRHHEYGSTSGECAYPPVAVTCDDTTVFNLYSYITFDKLDFGSNMDDILLFDIKDTDVDLIIKSSSTTDRLDVSVDTLRTLNILSSTFNTGKTLYYNHVPDITINNVTINTDAVYHDGNFNALEIDKSRVFLLDMDINITRPLDGNVEVTGATIDNTFVKEMDIDLNMIYDGETPPVIWTYVSNDYEHAIAIRDDGTMWGAGDDFDNLFGIDEETFGQTTFKQLGTDTDWLMVETSDYWSLAIKTDGTLWGTGNNYKGQLGQGHNNQVNVWTQIGTDTDWTDIAVGYQHALALKSDQTMWVCGDNTFGQCGDPETSFFNIFTDVTRWTGIVKIACSSGGNSSYILYEDGYGTSFYSTGYNNVGELAQGDFTTRYQFTKMEWSTEYYSTIAAGDRFCVAISYNGYGDILEGAGMNDDGQYAALLEGDYSTTLQREQSYDEDWAILGTCFDSTYCIKSDGTLWATGGNWAGQLGLGDEIDRGEFTQIGTDNDWAFITKGGAYTAMFIKNDGTMWGVGENGSGELGIGVDDGQNVLTLTQVLDT